jgi:hypothetical protein
MVLQNQLTVFRGDYRYIKRFQDVACLSGDAVGQLMCIRGDRINGKWRVQRADPQDVLKMPAIGILVSKSTPTVGVMQWIGPVEGVYTGLDVTKPAWWVGNGGTPSESHPLVGGVGNYAFAQQIGIPVAADVFLLNVSLNMFKKIG